MSNQRMASVKGLGLGALAVAGLCCIQTGGLGEPFGGSAGTGGEMPATTSTGGANTTSTASSAAATTSTGGAPTSTSTGPMAASSTAATTSVGISSSSSGGLGDGDGCTKSSDCVSGNCFQGVCCNTACTGVCMSCLAADTGKNGGDCAKVKDGLDPDGSCISVEGTCNGSGACACSDGVQDHDETDIDCGGASCIRRCATGQKCVTNADCMSENCPGSHICQ